MLSAPAYELQTTPAERAPLHLVSDHGQQQKQKPKSALLLEDNEINAMVATEFLQTSGVPLVHHIGSLDAFRREAFAIHDGAYDLIVADIMLPDGLATTVVRELRRQGCRLPIAAYTARNSASDLAEYAAAGIDHVFKKPLSLDDFQKGLEQLLNKGATS